MQATRPLGVIEHGGLAFLAGSVNYDSQLPATGQLSLTGMPIPLAEWSGVLRSGNGVLTAYTDPGGVIAWTARQGPSSASLSLDGIVFRTVV